MIRRGHTARARVQARRPLGLGPTPGAGGALGARAGRHPRPRNGKSRSGTVLSRLAGHFSVSQCALFRFIPGFKRDKNCLETEIFLFRDRNISVSERKIFLFGNRNFTVSIQSNFRFRTENISVLPQNKLFCSTVSERGSPGS